MSAYYFVFSVIYLIMSLSDVIFNDGYLTVSSCKLVGA